MTEYLLRDVFSVPPPRRRRQETEYQVLLDDGDLLSFARSKDVRPYIGRSGVQDVCRIVRRWTETLRGGRWWADDNESEAETVLWRP